MLKRRNNEIISKEPDRHRLDANSCADAIVGNAGGQLRF